MILSTEKYLDSLLSFIPKNKGSRLNSDYVSLIHVPAIGSECVYSLSFDEPHALLTVARYKEAVWKNIEDTEVDARPELDALQASVSSDHPVFQLLDLETLATCENISDGSPASMDYYLMLWQKNGQANVVECYEPYSRESKSWINVIGALQALSSQFEYAALES